MESSFAGKYRTLTPEEATQMGLPAGATYQVGPDGQVGRVDGSTAPKPEFQELPNGDYGVFDPTTRQFEKLGSAPKPTGQAGAFDLTMPDGTKITMGGQKPPSGFMPDPEDPSRLTPIPGGPGEQIPSELAARIGMADNFMKDAPAIRKELESGAVTGWMDRFQAGNSASSAQAGVYRKLQSGADALMRMLTGAGMNETEARAYADRYLPGYGDDAGSAAAKLDQLVNELSSAREMAMRGRGGMPERPPEAGVAGSGGANYKDRYGLE